MARLTKTSLDYFPLDVNFLDDPKVALVLLKHGPIVSDVLIRLLGEIYGREGYWMEWNEDAALLFSVNVCHKNVTIEEAQAIVTSLIERKFFDSEVYKRTGKLTSRGIQARWKLAMKAAHKPADIDPEINLLDKDDEQDNSELSPPLSPQNSELSPANSETLANNSETFAKPSRNFAKDSGDFAKPSETFAKTSENFALNKIKEKETKAITPPPNPPLPREVGDGEGAFDECSSREEMLTLSEAVITSWNETFAGTDRTVNPVNQNLKPFYRENLIAAQADGITLDQFRRAFAVLKRTPRFEWQLHSAVKPDNVRLLLTEGENARKRKRAGPVLQVYRDDVYSKTAEDFYKR